MGNLEKSDKKLVEEIKKLKAKKNRKSANEIWKILAERKKGLIRDLISKELKKKYAIGFFNIDSFANHILSISYEKIENYKPKYAFSTWIGAIAINKTIDEVDIIKELTWTNSINGNEGNKILYVERVGYVENTEARIDARREIKELMNCFKKKRKFKCYHFLLLCKGRKRTLKSIALSMGFIKEGSEKKLAHAAEERINQMLKKTMKIAEECREEYKGMLQEKYMGA